MTLQYTIAYKTIHDTLQYDMTGYNTTGYDQIGEKI